MFNIFNKKKELKDFYSAISLIDEIFVEIRKGIPQTQYVIVVSDEPIFYNEKDGEFYPAPIEFQGYWIQEDPDDNTQISLKDRIGIHSDIYKVNFVKAKKVQITIDSFERL